MQVLQEQLAERKKQRVREEEQLERERLVMLAETKRLQDEELRGKVEKQLKAKQLIAEVCSFRLPVVPLGTVSVCSVGMPAALTPSQSALLACLWP